jgi:bifunctional DNA-binding transcriptional regulator/antitoxin component of YhaV-PrlF toxin-antitoxin module
MHITKCQKHRLSVHVIIPRQIRHALNIVPGTNLVFIHTLPGVVEIRNADTLMQDQIKDLQT